MHRAKKKPPILSEAHGSGFGFRYRPKRHFPTSTYTNVIEVVPDLSACTPNTARSKRDYLVRTAICQLGRGTTSPSNA